MGRDKVSENERLFRKLLKSQKMSSKHKKYIESKREKVQNRIEDKIDESLKFYYGGSYGRNTMIREYSDMNLVVYYPKNHEKSIKEIHSEVGKVVTRKWRKAELKILGWEIPYKTNFHIDIIPAKLVNSKICLAEHYNSDLKEPIEVSLKEYDENIKQENRTDIIKLIRLWKVRCEVPLPCFLLEKFVTLATRGSPRTELETQLFRSFSYLEDHITTKKIPGAINKGYDFSNRLRAKHKIGVKDALQEVREAKDWEDAFNE